MFLIREAKLDDSDMLFKLARTSHFVNLPPAKDIIESKIVHARQSMRHLASQQRKRKRRPSEAFDGPLFMFCAEDPESGHCLGTSMIISRMGSQTHPNVAFRLEKEEFFSDDLHIGTSTQTLILSLDTSGPTEVGGLILTPGYRRHPARIGKQLSLIRFHFIGLHRSLFGPKLLAEMMAPIDDRGNSPFWEYLGRRFINLTYEEAYRASQRTRDFMLNLLPRDPIYVSLLPPEARRVIGAVGPDTVPARRLIESLGFRYNGNIDPFDGGPHLDAKTDSIDMVKRSRFSRFAGVTPVSKSKQQGFVSVLSADGLFRAVHTKYAEREGDESVMLPKAAVEALRLEGEETIGVTPLSLSSPSRVVAEGGEMHRSPNKASLNGSKKRSKKNTTKAQT